ncbi:MAG: hypothetical protein ACKV19_21675 [Verrucomicrobiales bacterium]
MGIDIDWYSVDWEEFTRRYVNASDTDEVLSEVFECGAPWTRRLDMDEDWLALLESWYALLEFNDDLGGAEPHLHHSLRQKFPCLAHGGIIWDAETLSPCFPMDITNDKSGSLIGALSPLTTRRLHDELAALDRTELANLINGTKCIDDPDLFGGSANFITLVDLLTEVCRQSVSENRGLLIAAA